MNERHRFESVDDFLSLTEEEFARMLPDLIGWHRFSRVIKVAGSKVNFIWIDDGRPGEVDQVDIRINGSDEVMTMKLGQP